MNKYRVAVTFSEEYPVRTDCVNDILKNIAVVDEIEMPFNKLNREEVELFIKKLLPYDAILVRSGIFEENLLNKLINLKMICVHGAGYDQIDIDCATKHGIYVLNVPGSNANAVIELTMGLILTSIRKLYYSIFELKNNRDWISAKINGNEMNGKKLGVIGLGNIGKGVIKRALAFNMDIIGYDPYISIELRNELNNKIVVCENIDEIFLKSDIITLHLPLNEKTKYIINRKTLSKMKKTSIIINTSRGALINEDDLFKALYENKIAGAALDVFSQEPLSPQNRMFLLDNLILTPHIGGSTYEALELIAKTASENIYHFLSSMRTNNSVNSPNNARYKI